METIVVAGSVVERIVVAGWVIERIVVVGLFVVFRLATVVFFRPVEKTTVLAGR